MGCCTHHRGLDNRRLHDVGRLWGPGLVGLLAVLLHLDGAAGGLGRGVGDRLLLNPRLRPPVVLLAREAAGGDGAADAAERQDDEEKNDENYNAAMVRAWPIILSSSPRPLSQTAPALHLRASTSEIYVERTRLKFGSDAASHGRQ